MGRICYSRATKEGPIVKAEHFPVTLEGGREIWESKVRNYVDSNYGELIQADIHNTISDGDRALKTGNETCIVPLKYVAPNRAVVSYHPKIQPLLILTDIGRIIIERIAAEEPLFEPDKWIVLDATSRDEVVKNIDKTFAQIAKMEKEAK